MVARTTAALGCMVLVLTGATGGMFYNDLAVSNVLSHAFVGKAYALSAPASYLTIWGTLLNSGRSPVTGSQNLNFTLYDDLTLSTSAHHIYCETQTLTLDAGGNFVAQLGAGTACAGASWSGKTWPPSFSVAYYLAVAIGATGYTPRGALSAAGYFDGQVAWSQLITFPAECSANSAVATLAATPTCVAAMPSIVSTSVSTACAAGSHLGTASVSATVSTVAAAFTCTADVKTSIVSTSCGALSALVQAQSTTVSCSSLVPAASGATVSCASQSYVTSIATSTATCAQPFIFVAATTNQIMSTTTFTTIGALNWNMGAGVVYYIEGFFPYACSATEAFRVGVTMPATATLTISFQQYLTANVVVNFVQTTTSASTSTATCPAAPGLGIYFTGYASSSAGGTFSMLFDGGTAATTASVLGGAWLRAYVVTA